MRMHCIIHADFEQPGYYVTWAEEQDISVSKTYVHKGEKLPDPEEFDILLIMGGPQSPLELGMYPYLKDEMSLINRSIASDKFIIGVCLGAQLIAESYNARTECSPCKEIGVFPLSLTADGKKDPIFKHFPDTFQSGHWHNDMPGLPDNAKILAVSDGCPRQIIKFGEKIYGFQCHLEFDYDCVSALIENCPNDLIEGIYVQNKNEILRQDYHLINNYLKLFLQQMLHYISNNLESKLSFKPLTENDLELLGVSSW